jgi:hypothetical protein
MEDELTIVRELARVLVEIYEAGDSLTAGDPAMGKYAEVDIRYRITARHNTMWAGAKSLKESMDISPSFVLFKERSYFVKIDPIGLLDTLVCTGAMEEDLRDTPLTEVLGKESLDLILTTASKNAPGDTRGDPKHITFIGIFDQVDGGEWQFKGILPLDQRLDSVAYLE